MCSKTFEPIGSTPLRILTVYSPRGLDKFFTQAAKPAARPEIPPPPTSLPDVHHLAQIGVRFELRAPA